MGARTGSQFLEGLRTTKREIWVDGERIEDVTTHPKLGEHHGVDIDANGDGPVTGQRLYQLVRQRGPVKERTFEIRFLDPGVQAYAFTFGCLMAWLCAWARPAADLIGAALGSLEQSGRGDGGKRSTAGARIHVGVV